MTDRVTELLQHADEQLRARSICTDCGKPRKGLTWALPNGQPDIAHNGLCRCVPEAA